MKKKPSTPPRQVMPPTIRKNSCQFPAWVRLSRAPNTTSMATSGIMASTVSTRPRFSGTVTSVTQALKAASLAVEPKKVITQSITTTSTAAPWAAPARGLLLMKAKAPMLTPHSR